MDGANINSKSLFLVVEGVDFAGKTTLIKTLKTTLSKDPEINKYFKEIIYTQEPTSGNIEFCAQIRKLAIESADIKNLTRACLFFANRCEHISKVVAPAMESKNKLVVCDRFYLSSLIYQSEGCPLMTKWIQETQKLVTNIVPNKTYVIDVSKELFLSRYLQKNGKNKNELDNYAYKKFETIKQKYLSLEQEKNDTNIGPIMYLSGDKLSTEEMSQEILKDIKSMIRS